MGRGRQKAKHTKVARALKYSVQETNYGELERELASGGVGHGISSTAETSQDELSKWSEYYEASDDADDEYGDYQPRRA